MACNGNGNGSKRNADALGNTGRGARPTTGAIRPSRIRRRWKLLHGSVIRVFDCGPNVWPWFVWSDGPVQNRTRSACAPGVCCKRCLVDAPTTNDPIN